MRSIVIGGVVLLMLAPVFGGDADKEQKALQGKWQGKTKEGIELELKIDGNKWKMTFKIKEEKKEFVQGGIFTLDPKKTPAAMDMMFKEDDLGRWKGKTGLAIYEIKEDTLRWASGLPGRSNRPQKFVDKDNVSYVEFRRAK